MATRVDSLFVDISARTGAYEKAMQRVQRRTQKLAKSMQQLGQRMTVAITLPLTGVGFTALRAASDAEEMRSKFGVVFGDMADDVESWAESHGELVGRSRLDLMEYAAQLQDTLVPMGVARDEAGDLSKAITELAVDLASFNNMAEAEVVQRLQSALVGNVRAVQRFGVVLNQANVEQELFNMGIQGGNSAATEAQRVMARLNVIMEGTRDAQGDAARTSESFANRSRALKSDLRDVRIEIGEQLLPAASDLIGVFSEGARRFSALDEATKSLTVRMGVLAAAAGPVLFVMGKITAAAVTLGKATAAVGAFAASLKGAFAAVAAGVGISITEAFGVTSFTRNAVEATGAIRDLQSAVADVATGSRDMEALTDTTRDVRDAIWDVNEQYAENRRRLTDLQARAEQFSGQTRANIEREIANRQRVQQELRTEAAQLAQLERQLRAVASAWRGVETAGADAGGATGDALAEIPTAARIAQSEIDGLRDSLSALMDEMERETAGQPIDLGFGQALEGSVNDTLERIRQARQAFHVATTEAGREAAAQRIAILEDELERRRELLQDDPMTMLEQAGMDAMQTLSDGLGDVTARMATFDESIGSVGDAFRELGRVVRRTMQQVIADIVAATVRAKILAALTGGGSAAGGALINIGTTGMGSAVAADARARQASALTISQGQTLVLPSGDIQAAVRIGSQRTARGSARGS